MTNNTEAQALETDIRSLQTQLRAKKDRLRQIRHACNHDWSEMTRVGFTFSWHSHYQGKRTCKICGDAGYTKIEIENDLDTL